MRFQTGYFAGLLLVFSACGDPAIANLDHDSGVMLESRSGIIVAEEVMQDGLSQITREVALALADPMVRQSVFEALHASQYREHKLHFGTLIWQDRIGFGQAVALARGQSATVSDVSTTLDGIIDLEFYMPVKEHFAAWEGGNNLIVASVLRDDGQIPIAFDLSGDRFPIASAEDPPGVPALVLVPVETDFSRPQVSLAEAGAAASAATTPGIYMMAENIPDDHEGWSAGDPEFEVHVFLEVSGEFVDKYCSGNGRTGLRNYDHNNTSQTWTGDVLLATQAEVATTDHVFHVWEDDYQQCQTSSPTGIPPHATESIADDINAIQQGEMLVQVLLNDTIALPSADSIAQVLISLSAINNDDFVGQFGMNGPSAGCWQYTGATRFDFEDEDGNYAGFADVDYRMDGWDRDPICALAVDIVGPSSILITFGIPVPPGFYSASVSGGGAGSTTYEWRVDDVLKQTGSSSTYTWSPTEGIHTVKVKAIRGAENDEDLMNVTVTDGCPPPQIFCE